MRQIVILIINLIVCWPIFSQRIDNSIFVAAGKQVEVPGLIYSYTIGQTFAGTGKSTGATINQGFNQNNVKLLLDISSDPSFSVKISAYPNPTIDYINIELKNIKAGSNIKLRLSDNMGRIIVPDFQKQEQGSVLIFKINMLHTKEGMYHILLYNEKSLFGAVNVIKQ